MFSLFFLKNTLLQLLSFIFNGIQISWLTRPLKYFYIVAYQNILSLTASRLQYLTTFIVPWIKWITQCHLKKSTLHLYIQPSFLVHEGGSFFLKWRWESLLYIRSKVSLHLESKKLLCLRNIFQMFPILEMFPILWVLQMLTSVMCLCVFLLLSYFNSGNHL